MPKPNPKNAPEPRVEPPYLENARFFAEMFLLFAHRRRHPRQQALLVEYMLAADGLNLAYLVRDWFDNLDQLARRLDEASQGDAEGDGEGEGRW